MRVALALAMLVVAAAPLVLLTIGTGGGVAPGLAHADGPNGHEASEGFVLAASEPPQRGSAPCPDGAPVRRYDVAAISVDITLNRYLDHDPAGRMYVLEDDLPRVRAEEAQNRRARQGNGEPAVTLGLQGDAIQPLTLRVLPGECLRIRLRNALGEPVSLHLHGAGLRLADTKVPALATDSRAFARPGGTVTYEWMVAETEREGTHYFHSHGDNDRVQTSHGLFGAVIVEPKGSAWLDPLTGRPLRTGWAAMVRTRSGPSFREYAIYYHEIGAENEQLLDRRGRLIPLVDPILGDYRPASRALNYRSEPFINRMALQRRRLKRFDESVAYSSYAFGDPATPIMRAYLGDPVKQRVIHGGSDVFHVHHVHGGSIRWRRQPYAEPGGAGIDRGLVKFPPLRSRVSDRTDSQSIGPSETFDTENECGAGGCQQSAGDFLLHCHVAHHYFAGMWGIWRVYNTRQDGRRSTDTLPPLRELPDRAGKLRPAVTSDRLAGARVDWFGRRFTISPKHLNAFVERQLPPRGVPRGYDASVLDWSRSGSRYLGEPESRSVWPGYRSPEPGKRPELLFDPITGKLAYPFLRPHLGKRPPFAPNHGPAPFLDPTPNGRDPPPPGANGPWSLCPAGTRLESVAINAITLPIPFNRRAHVVDPVGEIYVLRSEEEAVRRSPDLRRPLAIRANAGEHCVDVLLRSELEDNEDNHGFAKADAHIHFVQFDIQASDGVDTGFNYEQSVRPFRVEGERLTRATPAGDDDVEVSSTARFQPGAVVGVGMDRDTTLEVRRIARVEGRSLVFDQPLRYPHGAGEYVSAEFVRYRWYPDVQFGTAYFHDHVNAISSWRHGLFGALISEPPGSTYRDPRTGARVKSGPVADIHTSERVTHDIAGSFRELVLFIQDDNPINSVGLSTGSAYNLRAEPLDARGGDPARYFSSRVHGDPETPVLEAYLGDPLMVRTLVAATNDVHTWHVDGHWFRVEPYSSSSPPTSTIHVGISERYDLAIPRAGGPQRMPGDYLFYSGRSFKLREGSWGLIRVHGPPDRTALRKLPGHKAIPAPAAAACPPGSPRKRFGVAAVEAPLPMLGVHTKGKMYVLEGAPQPGGPAPLVLHVNVGDCIEVRLRNATTSGPVSLHADMLAFDPKDSGGVEAGRDPPQAVPPGGRRTFTFYAHPEVGQTVALVRDFADVINNPGQGLYGAIVVGPKGSSYTDPVTGQDSSRSASWRVDVHPPGAPAYRDFTLFLQDEDPSFGTHRMPYNRTIDGVAGLNYRAAPLPDLAVAADPSQAFHGQATTPVMDAFVGDPVRVHVLAPASEQVQVFTLEEHQWPLEPGLRGTNMLSSVALGGLEAITLRVRAGGPAGLPGSYVYGNHREPYREAGQWGIFRVRCGGDGLVRLGASPAACDGGSGVLWIALGGGTVLLLGFAAAFAWRRRNGRAWLPARAERVSGA